MSCGLMIAVLQMPGAAALAPTASTPLHLLGRPSAVACQRGPSLQCCICINCKLVDRCKVYHWVETMHTQPHVTTDPDFDPADPQVLTLLVQMSLPL